MKMRRTVTLTVMLLVVLCSVAEGSAYAKEGIFKKGTEELPAKKKFTVKLGGSKIALEIGEEGTLECTGASGSGELTSTTATTGSIVLTGCNYAGTKCKTTGMKVGEVKLPEVSGEIVFSDNSGTLGPAILWSLPKSVTITCTEAQSLTLGGSVLASLPNVAGGVTGFVGDEMAATFEQSGGVQRYVDYVEKEGGEVKEAGLTTSASGALNFSDVKTGVEAEFTIGFEEEVSVFASRPLKAGIFKKGTEEIPTKDKFTTSLTGSAADLQFSGVVSYECTGASGAGEWNTTTTAASNFKFTGCAFAGTSCHTSGAAAGEIVVPEFDLKIVLADTGNVLTPALLWSLPKTLVVGCGGGEVIEISGAVLASLPEGAGIYPGFSGKSIPLEFESSGGYQKYTHYVETGSGTEKEALLVSSITGYGSKIPTGIDGGFSIGLEEEVTISA